MKQLLRIIWFKFIGNIFFPLVKPFYSPRDPISRKLRFIGKFAIHTDDGKKFYLFNNAFHLETDIFWRGFDKYHWEKTTRRVWIELCRSSDTIFDIGSNTGIFSVLAKAYQPKSTVVAFEPQPNIFDVLKKNNEVNHFDICCENLALSNQNGELPFYNSGSAAFTLENSTSGSLNKSWRPDDQDSILVKVKQLKDYLNESRITRIDLIKIDVETFEYEVLSGYGKYLLDHQPVLVIEILNRTIGKNIESLLAGSTYTYYSIDEERGLIKVTELGVSENNNYVLCPESKLRLIMKFVITN